MKLKREAFSECISNVAAQAGVNEDDAFKIIQDVAAYGDKLRRQGQGNPFDTASMALAEREKQAAIQARGDALRNALARTKILHKVYNEGGIAKAADNLRSYMHWVPGAKDNNNVESQWHGLGKLWQATVGNALKQAGLEEAAIDGGLDHEVAEAWWRLNGGKADDTVKVSSNAQKMAEILKPSMDLARDRLNGAGAHIGDAIDYVTHTTWDPRQLRLAAGPGATVEEAFEAWWSKEGSTRGADKTFEHLVPKEGQTFEEAKKEFGESFFKATISGVHKSGRTSFGLYDDGENGFVPPAYEGTRNLGRKVSQQRVWFWKDAKSWMDHMQGFGGGHSLYFQSMNSLEQSARRVALMEKFGTNPEANFNSVVRKIQEKYRGDPDGLAKFNHQVEGGGFYGGLRNVMDYLTGKANIPANADWADRINQILNIEATSKLGGVAVPHAASAPMTVSSELAHHGVSHLDAIGGILRALATGRGSVEKQEALAQAGAYAHGYNLLLGSKLQRDKGVPGYISWAATNFMRMTGLPNILNKLQADGVKSVLMTKLGRSTELAFDKLDPEQAATLSKYGIKSQDWDLLRSTKNDLSIEGQRYLTPKHASMTDASATEAMLRSQGKIRANASEAMVARAVKKYQWELGDKYLMYLNDASERATVTPGVREKAIVMAGARPGTVGWATRRALSQFKMWPLAAYNQIINRELGSTLTAGQKTANFGWILALSTAAGALRLSVNDAVAGRPQRNFADPGNLFNALGQGGGLGIYGDVLFGEINRGMNGSLVDLAGPAVGDVNTLNNIRNGYMADLENPAKHANNETPFDYANKHLMPELAHFTVGHIPFANLIYLKGALDYMAFYHIYEAAAPGWWDRTNKRLEKESGQTMQGYSPGQGVPYGVPGLKKLTGIGGV